MYTHSIELLLIHIPQLGDCTLFSKFETLPISVQMYKYICSFREVFHLRELPSLTHHHTQEIFKSLSLVFSEIYENEESEIKVLLSGTHFSYPSIGTDLPDQVPVECVTSMVFNFWHKENASALGNSNAKHFEMFLDETPTNERQLCTENVFLSCLFLGNPQQK